jgi:N-acetylmuramoyl-L-alanine amidase
MLLLAAALTLITPLSAPNAGASSAPVDMVIARDHGAASHVPTAGMAKRPSRNIGFTAELPPITKGPAVPRIDGPADKSRPLILIDPGHGGHDPGAYNVRTKTAEKDLTLAVATAVREALLGGGRVRVALTREDDRFLALEERFGLAQDMGAALFISIHADSSDDAAAHGATVYTLSDVASDQEAARLATRENRANLLNGVNLAGASSAVAGMLIDLARSETLTGSVRFAQLLNRESAPLVPFREPWHRHAALVVLRSPDVPSVLFEMGYMSNDGEAARLNSAEGRRRIAQGVARAVTIFVATRNR